MTNEQQPFYFGSFTFLPKLAVLVKGTKMRANVCVIYSIKTVISTNSQLCDLL